MIAGTPAEVPEAAAAAPVRARLPDGTAFYAPMGELVRGGDGRVLCHLCGRWLQALAPAHLARSHGIKADAYREAFGLNRGTQLRSLRLVRGQRRVKRRLLATDPRLQHALVEAR